MKVLQPRHLPAFIKATEYRTYNYAGLPKGSYAIPNPIHFHIARYKNTTKPMRASIIRLTTKTRKPIATKSATLLQIHNNSNSNEVRINFDEERSITLNIPLNSLKELIYQFAIALNMLSPVERKEDHKSCQTSYVVSKLDESFLCNVEDDEYEKSILDSVRDNLINDLSKNEDDSINVANWISNNDSLVVQDTNDDVEVATINWENYEVNNIVENEIEDQVFTLENVAVVMSSFLCNYSISNIDDESDVSQERLKYAFNHLNQIYKSYCTDYSDVLRRELKSRIIDIMFNNVENSSGTSTSSISSNFEHILLILDSFFNNPDDVRGIYFNALMLNYEEYSSSTPKKFLKGNSVAREERRNSDICKKDHLENNDEENVVISFKSNESIKSKNESYWFAITKSPVKETNTSDRKVINVDEIPLKVPLDILINSAKESSETISRVTESDKNAVVHDVQFYRTTDCNVASYSHETNVTFLKENDVDNSTSCEEQTELNSSDDEDNWMGYEAAKF